MTPPCTFLLAALLVVVASAQWPRLPKIDPGHIAGVVQGAEKEATQTLSQKNHLLSQVPSVADNVPQSAAQAVSASALTVESTKAIAGDSQTQQQVLASKVAKEANNLRSQAPSVADKVAQSTAQAVSASVQTVEAAKAIAGDAQSQQQVLASEVTKEAKHIRSQAPSVADNAAQSAVQAVSASAQTAEAAKAITGDAQAQQQVGAIGGPAALNPSKVTGGPSKVVDGASTQVEAVSPMIHEAGMPAALAASVAPVALAVPATPAVPAAAVAPAAQVAPAAPSSSPVGPVAPVAPAAPAANSIGKYINGNDPEPGEQAPSVDQGVKWVGLHWQWSLLFIAGALGVLVFGWRVTKHRHAQSPTLLPGSDMAGWNGESDGL